MSSSGTQAASFITVLAPIIKNAGLDLKITCCDAEGWNGQVTMTSQLIAAGVENDLGVITSHSYASSPTSPISTKLKVWETEYADLDDAFTPNNWYSSGAQGEGLTWANKIYTAIVNANVSAYLYWEGEPYPVPVPRRTAFASNAAEIAAVSFLAVRLHEPWCAPGIGVERLDSVTERLGREPYLAAGTIDASASRIQAR